VSDFASQSRAQQRQMIARVQRTRGVRHPRVGRGNTLPTAPIATAAAQPRDQ
jgi:hypothetical protein